MPGLGEPFEIRWKAIGHSNSAAVYWFYIDVEVFMHRHSDEDVVRIFVTQEWCDTHPWEDHFISDEYVKYHIDGAIVDPDDPFDHVRIDPPE